MPQISQAQTAPDAPAPASAAAPLPTRTLDTVVVTGNPLGSPQIAAPVSVLSGDGLVLRRGSSLGDTLNSLPGVSSTYFGPNANRPVIRGLDGDRVRILSNGGASMDASSLSYDHAVPIEPLIADRIEVLRGPGALFYGGSAVGGVVNTLDNRIPRAPMEGFSGAAEVRFGGAARTRGGAALIESGNDRFAVHADVFGRDTSDQLVPRYTPVEDGEPLARSSHVRNSAAETRGGALGGSLFFGSGADPAQGRVGLSVDTYHSDYGITAEPGVMIQLKRDHVGFAGEIKLTDGPLRAVRLNANYTDYQHREVEGDGAVGTVFSSQGHDVRLEVEHAPIGPLRGVLGLQHEDFDFSALGEEAFVPETRTRKTGLFALEELAWVGGTLSVGARLERAEVDSDGDADPLSPKFGAPVRRNFWLQSYSLANVVPLAPAWSLSASLSATERAPTYFELYANGVHAATGSYEQGNTRLPTERGTNVDLAVQWKTDTDRLRVGTFYTRFSRFISLDASGDQVDESGAVVAAGTPESVPLYRFNAVRARLYGVEIEGRKRLAELPWQLDGTTQFDMTRGTNLSTGEPLPRIAPWRLKLGLDAARGPWTARIEADHAARQNRVPDTDRPTASYTLVNLSLSQRINVNQADAIWFVKLTNLGNERAYSASTIQTIRGLSPLPGRAVEVGMRVTF
ncbi:MAG: membrane receptor protein [Burkholderiales bacterium PBB1]|nr:MAG: membrane receptor protein [Burkholderiales bacterium PBB1]